MTADVPAAHPPGGGVAAVIFDLDGVIVDTEGLWDEARREVAAEHGGRWEPGAQGAMMGMSSPEWSSYMHRQLGVTLPPAGISEAVVGRLASLLRRHLPLIPGARDAVLRVGAVWPLALASSANRPVIDLVLDLAGLTSSFRATVSSEEVPRGKPAPDVYLAAAARVGALPGHCVAVEDSHNGIRSAATAGMTVVAVPNKGFPPDDEAVALAADVLDAVAQLTPERVARAAGRRRPGT